MSVLSSIVKVVQGVVNAIGSIGSKTANALNPSTQIQAVGGRRVWVSILVTVLSMVFVIVGHILNIPDELIYSALAIGGVTGGAFVVGESVKDNTAAKQ